MPSQLMCSYISVLVLISSDWPYLNVVQKYDPDTVAHGHNPSMQETEKGRHEFWVNLGDIVRPCFTKQNSPQDKNKTKETTERHL